MHRFHVSTFTVADFQFLVNSIFSCSILGTTLHKKIEHEKIEFHILMISISNSGVSMYDSKSSSGHQITVVLFGIGMVSDALIYILLGNGVKQMLIMKLHGLRHSSLLA